MTSGSSEHQESICDTTDEVKAFFDKWSVYKKAMDANYFGHREAYSALNSFLMSEFPHGFSLIDFGCGDAYFVAAALRDTAVEKYIGVDLSGVALELARENMEELRCDRHFLEGDFLVVAKQLNVKVDVIWIGLNLHHLPHDGKDQFLAISKKLLNPGGSLILFEPTCVDGESRADHAKRWWRICQRKWTALSRHEMELLKDHIFSADYPETFRAIEKLARGHGFREIQSMFREPDKLYEMVRLAI